MLLNAAHMIQMHAISIKASAVRADLSKFQ